MPKGYSFRDATRPQVSIVFKWIRTGVADYPLLKYWAQAMPEVPRVTQGFERQQGGTQQSSTFVSLKSTRVYQTTLFLLKKLMRPNSPSISLGVSLKGSKRRSSSHFRVDQFYIIDFYSAFSRLHLGRFIEHLFWLLFGENGGRCHSCWYTKVFIS